MREKNNAINYDLNYDYIKKLAMFFKKMNYGELFTALVLMERYTFIDDIKILTNDEIKNAHKKYGEYLKSKDTLINRRWL